MPAISSAGEAFQLLFVQVSPQSKQGLKHGSVTLAHIVSALPTILGEHLQPPSKLEMDPSKT